MSRIIKQLVKTELDRIFREHDYWGSEEQIDNEMLILMQTGVQATEDESIEEYYLRIYDSL
jgi:hypothetical protein